jgi:hypothetical protein
MPLPTYDATKHDVSIDGYGFMLAPAGGESPASLARVDGEPATSRAAIGDGGSENFTLSSYFFHTDVEGGVGQTTLASADRGMTAIADTRFQGHIFPPKKVLTTGSTGGAASGYFREGSTLYGILATTVENISSGASTASALPVRTGQRPRTSSSGSTFWTTTSLTLLKKALAGAISAASLPSGVTPYLFDLYTRFAWVVGRRTLESDATFVQMVVANVTNTQVTGTFASVPGTQSVLVASIATGGVAPATVDTVPSGWELLTTEESPSGTYSLALLICRNPTASDQSVTFKMATSEAWSLQMLEFTGIDKQNPLLGYGINQTTTAVTTGTVIPATSGTVYIIYRGDSTVTNPAGTTQLGVGLTGAYDLVDTNTSLTYADVAASDGVVGWIKLRPNAITADLAQTVFLYSDDDGASWSEAFNGDSAGMPIPIASLAAMGSLWLTTEYGLYEFRSEDIALDSGESRVQNGIRGPMDEFQYPHGETHIGTALANFDGSLYYNLGATLRRFPPGGRAEQIWPPRGWSIGGGNVISVVSGEGGIYFGTDDGFLWNYDGRGFHQIAEATADQLSVLHWHAGKLYMKGDPAPYFEYGYPSMRPDVYASAPTTYDVGYFITSIINFEKVGDLKVARRFETQAEFSAGVNATESGTLTLQYCIIDEGFHPDIFTPDDETADWVTVGTHSVADGNVKNYTLGTPIEFKRLLLRIILTPGTVGIPICEGFGVDGEAMMLWRSRFPMNLSISTNTVHRGVNAGGDNLMYPTEDAVAEAIDQLRRWRNPEHASHDPVVTVIYRETGGATTTHTCILEKLDHYLESHQGADGAFSHVSVQCVFREIP